MPILNNINSPITPINRKTISKVSLNVGESFKGELINLEGEEALILLPGGYKLRARIVGNLKEAYLSRFLFQLEDFKDGKVFLKIIREETTEEFKGDLKNKFFKEGIAPEDEDMASLLLRHNIPLSKSNLSFVKSIFFLWGEGLKSVEYIDKLLDKYIKLKGGSFEPLKEGEVRLKLKEAFMEISTLTEDDIIIFLENDIALSKENINGYKKLMDSTGILFDAFKTLEGKTGLSMIEKELLPKDIDTTIDYLIEDAKIESTKTTLERGMKESEVKPINESLEEADNSSVIAQSSKEKSLAPKLRGYSNEVKNNIKAIFDKILVEGGSEIEAETAAAEVNADDNKNNTALEKEQIKGAMIKDLKVLSEEVLEELVIKGKELKEMVEKVIEEVNRGKLSEALEKELNIMTKDLKILNQLSKDYYYLDIPLTVFNKDFPLKMIIKDNREGGKTLDSKDIKLVISVDAPRLGIIDGYIEIKERKLKVNIAVPKESLQIFKRNEESLLSSLNNLGYNTDIQFNPKEEGHEVSLLTRFFQQGNSVLVDVLA